MGKNRKKLEEMLFKDSFMFAAVMSNPDIAKGVIERALGREVDHVSVDVENTILYNPEQKGIRLDVYAKDEQNNCFNVEMQVVNQKIFKRARYYHSQVDMDLLGSGEDYESLPDSYVIFICDFDPIGQKKYRYTVTKRFEEDLSSVYDDGTYTIFLSTKGKNDDEEPEALVKFLKFVGEKENIADESDAFSLQLQNSVELIRKNRKYRRLYMVFEEIKKQEYEAGRMEGREEGREEGRVKALVEVNTKCILLLLNKLQPVPYDVEARIRNIQDADVLSKLMEKAIDAESIDLFVNELELMNY